MGSLWASIRDSNINSVFSPENNGLSHYASHDQLPSSPRGYMEYDFVSNKRTETAVYNSYCTLDIDDNDYSISGESINMPTIITSPEIQDKTDDGVDDEDSGNQSAPQRSSPSDHTYSYLFGSSRNTTQDMEHVHGVCSYTHILHFLFITSYINHAIQMGISVFIIQMGFIILNRFGTTVHIIFL